MSHPDRSYPVSGETRTKTRNLPAQLSLWFVAVAVLLVLCARALRSFLPDIHYLDPYFGVPFCGVVAMVLGVVGLTRVRTTGSGRTGSIIGLIVGSAITLLSVAVILFIWEWSRTNIPF